jgi:hypothetical protein
MAVRHHPVYVVRLPNNEGCGHQHDTDDIAWNCAGNIARARKNLAWIQVVKVSMRASGPREIIVGQIAQYTTCKECKGLVLTMDDGSERGHYEHCSLFVKGDKRPGRARVELND